MNRGDRGHIVRLMFLKPVWRAVPAPLSAPNRFPEVLLAFETLLAIATLVLALAAACSGLVLLFRRPAAPEMPPELSARLSMIEARLDQTARSAQEETRATRAELRSQMADQSAALDSRLQALETRLQGFSRDQAEQLSGLRLESQEGRKQLDDTVQALSARLSEAHRSQREELAKSLEGVAARVEALTQQNNQRQEALRETVAQSLDKVRADNSEKLEKMRATVEEKLQGTLEKRLGESFRQVSDRLEQVHKGLGEMQTLATGVGDLKRIMGNVKSRGGWGEVQLGMLLEDMLTPDQFATNVRIRPDANEIVEFAVRLPGRGDTDQPLWLPIDAKLPHEDYDRLIAAQEAGLQEDAERAAQNLERAIRKQAQTISDKYVHPPYSTDFGIMYLPTEGLFAEVVRRPGLLSELQAKHRIMVQGPTTLAALLTSLQMGFRTLAIEKRSSEVWQILAAAKAEFLKYGDVWDKLGKQLDTAKRTVDDAGRRTRAISRKLRDVDTLAVQDGATLIDTLIGAETEEAEAPAQEA